MLSLSLLQVVILLPLLALVTAWLYIQWAYHRQLSLARKLPTAIPAYPLVGHLLDMTTKFRVGSKMGKLASGHRSGLSCLWLGPVPWLLTNKSEHMKVILNNSNSLEKAKLYDVLKIVFGKGLLTAPELLSGPDLEIEHKSEAHKELVKGLQIVSGMLGDRIYNPFLRSDLIFKLLKKQKLNILDVCCKHIKGLREKSQELNGTVKSNGQINQAKTFLDIFNVLKEKDPTFDEDYLLEELRTLFGTGAESTALTTASCLVALGSHPDIQNNLYEEIMSVVGESSEVYLDDISKMTYLDQVVKETLRYFSIAPFAARRCDSDVQLDGYTIPKDSTVVLSFIGLLNNEEVFPDPRRFNPDRFTPENSAERHSYSFIPFSGGPRNCIGDGACLFNMLSLYFFDTERFTYEVRRDIVNNYDHFRCCITDVRTATNISQQIYKNQMPMAFTYGKNYAMMTVKIVLVHLLKNYEIKSTMNIKNITYKYTISFTSADGYKISIRKRV